MKKIVLIALICIQIFYLCSCGASSGNSESNGNLNAGDNVSDDTTDNNGTDNSTDGGDNFNDEILSTDEITPDDDIVIIVHSVVVPVGSNTRPSDFIIRNNEAWEYGGDAYLGEMTYTRRIIEYEEGAKYSLERVQRNDPELYEKLNKIKNCQYFYRAGDTYICRFGDDYFFIEGILDGSHGGLGLTVKFVYYAEHDRQADEPRRTDPIDLYGEMNITAESIYAGLLEMDAPTIDVKIVNGELWDNGGERFYGEIKYGDFYFNWITNSYDLMERLEIVAFDQYDDLGLEYNEHELILWQNVDLYRDLDIYDIFWGNAGGYYCRTELTDSPLGEWCVIVRFDNDLYILPGERCDCCNTFRFDDIYHASLEATQ